jgi:1-acyl-sn-glycerol-3-phosphate acyltransferase
MRQFTTRLVASTLCGFARLVTGARAFWRAGPPTAVQRIYYGNHSSHADFVLIWASLPEDLRVRTRPVAGADYWNTTRMRRWVINEVLRGVVI